MREGKRPVLLIPSDQVEIYMQKSETRIPFKCSACGHESERGVRAGGFLSNQFVCEKCGATSIATGFLLFSVLYGAIVLLLTYLGIEMVQRLIAPTLRFEFVLAIVVITVVALIMVGSKYYWKLALRWRKQT